MREWGGSAIPDNRWDLLDESTPDVAPMVSVIVSHYRQPDQLARTLRALQRQDHPPHRLEVIVADDGSPGILQLPAGVRSVRQDDAGFRLAAVRNLGAAAATGDVLVFLDADTTPTRAFIRELVRLPALASDCITVGRRRHACLCGLPADADIEKGVVGRELRDPSWLVEGYAASRNLLDADDRSYRFVIGAVLACSRRLFDEVGGFDESFTTYGGEDWEWAYRAWIRGAMFAHVPAAVAWHDGPDAAVRAPGGGAAKNDEAIRLSELIPLPGSRGRGVRSKRVDIAVTGPSSTSTPGQFFVSVDSVVAAIPGSEPVDRQEFDRPEAFAGEVTDRLDRVRVRVDILQPVVVSGDALAAQVARVDSEHLGALLIVDGDGTELIRIASTRATARHAHWCRDDLFHTDRSGCEGVRRLVDEVDLEGYLGGWA